VRRPLVSVFGAFLTWFDNHVAPTRKVTSFETSLGYRFKDRALLERALTHSSARTAPRNGKPGIETDNERLEFLGDRVLGLAVAELLTETFGKANEGDLARRFNMLVRGETCAQVARGWQIGPFLNLSESEAESGGRDKETILADACEAVLAAAFLEAGFEAARKIVRRHWEPLVATQATEPAADAKSTLQEWAQAQGLPVPVYKEIKREGPDHQPIFTAEVRIDARRGATGSGANKRAAEQDAATALLVKAGVWKREKA
jgi:ribonuclease III